MTPFHQYRATTARVSREVPPSSRGTCPTGLQAIASPVGHFFTLGEQHHGDVITWQANRIYTAIAGSFPLHRC
jgi:hypothetical protein